MKCNFKDLTGKKFGRLKVLRRAGTNKHGRATWLCKCKCGSEKIIDGGSLRCGHAHSCYRGVCHPKWKGGRAKSGDYITVLSPNHPFANYNGRVLEHRLVMEKKIGRFLFPFETVHHKDGIGSNNKPSNLELRVGPHGKHQCVKDLIPWAIELLRSKGYTVTKRKRKCQ